MSVSLSVCLSGCLDVWMCWNPYRSLDVWKCGCWDVSQSVVMSICADIWMPRYLSSLMGSVWITRCLSTYVHLDGCYLSVWMLVCQFVCLSLFLDILMYVVCLSGYLLGCLCVLCLSACLSGCLSLWIYVCLNVFIWSLSECVDVSIDVLMSLCFSEWKTLCLDVCVLFMSV